MEENHEPAAVDPQLYDKLGGNRLLLFFAGMAAAVALNHPGYFVAGAFLFIASLVAWPMKEVSL